MTSPYIIKQVTILLYRGYLQSSDGSWHRKEDILNYEKHKPLLTPKQRFMRDKYLDKAFFSHDLINWYSTAEALITSINNKCKK
jgi:hypothetical protein